MKIRSDVAELLRAGASDLDIARQLHVSRKTAAAARRALGIPALPRGSGSTQYTTQYATPTDAFLAHTDPGDGGHVRWTGCVDNGVARIGHGGKRIPALRIAFRLHHGRDPEGRLTRTCGRPGCVAGGHYADRLIREANQRAEEEQRRIAAANRRADKAFAAIFGEAS